MSVTIVRKKSSTRNIRRKVLAIAVSGNHQKRNFGFYTFKFLINSQASTAKLSTTKLPIFVDAGNLRNSNNRTKLLFRKLLFGSSFRYTVYRTTLLHYQTTRMISRKLIAKWYHVNCSVFRWKFLRKFGLTYRIVPLNRPNTRFPLITCGRVFHVPR